MTFILEPWIPVVALVFSAIALAVSLRDHFSNKPNLRVNVSYAYYPGSNISGPDISIEVVNVGRQRTTITSICSKVMSSNSYAWSNFRDWGQSTPVELGVGQVAKFYLVGTDIGNIGGQNIDVATAYQNGDLAAAIYHSWEAKPLIHKPRNSRIDLNVQ